MKTLLWVLALCFAAQVASATTVGEKAEKLQALLGRYARNDQYSVRSGKALEAVKQYIFAKYKDDTDIAKEYKFVAGAKELATDQPIAGTVAKPVALDAVAAIDGFSRRQIDFAKALIGEIDDAGGAFGFDGFEQNGCAAPTPFLLILDLKGKKVYGLDLAPCSEG